MRFRGSESERERGGFMGSESGEREWGMLVGLSRETEVWLRCRWSSRGNSA